MLPVKGGTGAKSRLSPVPDRAGLATAMALDCLDAVLSTPEVVGALVVTDDGDVAAAARDLGAHVVGAGVPGLGPAVAAGLAAAPHGPVAVLLADLPALRPDDLDVGLDAVSRALDDGAGWAFVPDAEGTGTVLLAADGASTLSPAFGPGSAAAHELLGARRLDVDVPRLRRDVDTASTLGQAVTLGLGTRTRRSLDGVQATVLTFDPGSGSGAVVTDDGVRLVMPAEALDGSGLRHLRPGQRVTCLRDGDAVSDVRIVGVSG